MKIARDTAVKARSQAIIALKATLVTAAAELRADPEHLSDFKLVAACAAMSADDLDDPHEAMRHVLGSLARRWFALHEEIKVHSGHLASLTKSVAPGLVNAFGIGRTSLLSCSSLLATTNDRVRNEAAFAKLCGVCPVPTTASNVMRFCGHAAPADTGSRRHTPAFTGRPSAAKQTTR